MVRVDCWQFHHSPAVNTKHKKMSDLLDTNAQRMHLSCFCSRFFSEPKEYEALFVQFPPVLEKYYYSTINAVFQSPNDLKCHSLSLCVWWQRWELYTRVT